MAHSVIVGVQRIDGSRIDVPDVHGEPRPIMLRLGDGLQGAPSWPTAGETQVIVDAPTQLHLSGGGLTQSVPVKSITLDDTFEATNYDSQGESVNLSSGMLFSGNGITGTVRPVHVELSTNLAGWFYAPSRVLTLYATSGGSGGEVPIGDPNSVYSSNGSGNFWDDFPTVNGISTQTMVVRPESSGQNHTVRQSEDRLVDYTSSIGGTVGSYAVSAKPYENSSSQAPRHTKLFGSFQLAGQSALKTLIFPTMIDGAAVPADSAVVGKFLFGWRGRRTGSPYTGGAIEFPFVVTTDSSGNLLQFRTGVTGTNYATLSAGYNFSISAADLTTSLAVVDGIVPVGMSIALYSDDFYIEFWTSGTNQASDLFKFYWECSYGWGTT
jgi:hypothetical protein